MLHKLYVAHVYDQDGTTPVGTLTTDRPEDGSAFIKTTPTYSEQINGGQGELVLDLFTKFDDFSEGTLVDFMNVVTLDAVVIDESAKTQTVTRMYKGFVSRYEPYVDAGDEGVRVTLLGLVSLGSYGLYGGSPGYAVIHTTVDPQAIGQAVVTDLNANFSGGLLSYPSTTSTVGTNVSYTFTNLSHLDCLQKVKEFCPAGWWWKIDENGYYRLGAKASTPTHTFTLGRDVVSLLCPKDSEKVKNEIIVNGTAYSDLTSQATFGTGSPATGRRTLLITDANIADATTRAQRGNKELADNKDQKIKATVVVGNDYAGGIETIRAGDTCCILNFKLANAFFGSNNMQIVGMTYLGDTVSLELEEHAARFGLELAAFVG